MFEEIRDGVLEAARDLCRSCPVRFPESGQSTPDIGGRRGLSSADLRGTVTFLVIGRRIRKIAWSI